MSSFQNAQNVLSRGKKEPPPIRHELDGFRPYVRKVSLMAKISDVVGGRRGGFAHGLEFRRRLEFRHGLELNA